MRKFIIFAMIFALLSFGALAAEPVITSKNAAENIINISGAAAAGSDVSILILNPGYTEEDAAVKAAEAQQYVRAAAANENGYSFDVKMIVPEDGGGTYTVVINADGEKQKTTFSFYPSEAKLGIITQLNAAKSADDVKSILQRVMEVYSLDSFPLYKNASVQTMAEAVYNAKGAGFAADADIMYRILRECSMVASYNSGKAAVNTDGVIEYADVMGVTETDEYKDYTDNISAGGREKVINGMKNKGYKTIDELKEGFKNLVALECIVSYKSYGSGHVKEYLEKYSGTYKAAGCNYSKLDSISNKSDFYTALADSKATTLFELADTFNNYKSKTGGGSAGSGGGSGGGSVPQVSASAGTTPGYIPQQGEEINPPADGKFSDIEDVEWAKEAIETLSEMGAVNGKGDGIFDPYAPVTRAEFVKILVSAMSLSVKDAECTFSDVTEEWSKPYIASAAALGIVSGTGEGIFSPNEPITREQGAAMIYRAAQQSGIIFETGESELFGDDGEISDYAKEGVYALLDNNIINGKGNGIFAPKDNLQRAEAAKIIFGILQID